MRHHPRVVVPTPVYTAPRMGTTIVRPPRGQAPVPPALVSPLRTRGWEPELSPLKIPGTPSSPGTCPMQAQTPSPIPDSTTDKMKRRRRKASEMDRTFVCNVPGCGKAYGTIQAVRLHEKHKHGILGPAAHRKRRRCNPPNPHAHTPGLDPLDPLDLLVAYLIRTFFAFFDASSRVYHPAMHTMVPTWIPPTPYERRMQ